MPATSSSFVVRAPRGATCRPTRRQAVVRRRRLVAGGLLVFVLALFVLALFIGAGHVLANRGGDPASTPAVRPATRYVVQPGDTLWSLADQYHGPFSRGAYLDRLLDANGGSHLEVGQPLLLP